MKEIEELKKILIPRDGENLEYMIKQVINYDLKALDTLRKAILLSKDKDNLLSVQSLHVLFKTFHKEAYKNYICDLSVREYHKQIKGKNIPKPLNDNIRCSYCANKFFSTAIEYKYICDDCKLEKLGGKFIKND